MEKKAEKLPLTLGEGCIYYERDGVKLAEVTFPEIAPGVVDIDHTWVDGALRGQGAAGQLMEAATAELRRTGRKARTSCSYAQKWMASHPEYADLLDG